MSMDNMNPLAQRIDPFQQACIKLRAFGYEVAQVSNRPQSWGLYDVIQTQRQGSALEAYMAPPRPDAHDLTEMGVVDFAHAL